jgi:SAM-dependent methyltransferase
MIEQGLAWQTDFWNRMAHIYVSELDKRFAPVIDGVLKRARLRTGETVLDLGTGTGSAALAAANLIAPSGRVTAVDLSIDMLALAQQRAVDAGIVNVAFREGRGEQLPTGDEEFDVILASLSLMYAIDRVAAARECARVLKPGGRFVASVWGGPQETDIVRFQATAGSFAPTPPVSGVGPGALADPGGFLEQLRDAGIDASVETEDVLFDFPDFDTAWNVLSGVTAAALTPERIEEAKTAVRGLMWPDPTAARTLTNKTHFIVGRRL